MTDQTTIIRDTARRLLDDKVVDVVIGFEEGTLPLSVTPCFIRSSAEVGRLIWNSACGNNLARYLPKRAEKIGIVAKACDVRSIIGLIQEGQIKREQLVIIGVPCTGVIDRKKAEAAASGKEILAAEEKGDQVVLKGKDFELTVSKDELLHSSCQACTTRNPVLCDVLVGEKVKEDGKVDEYQDIKDFEALTPDERWQRFTEEVSKCLRCYACRNSCPMCYCRECFVDCSQPQWIGKSLNSSDNAIFHLIRAFHTAGRCVDCGACERACPVGINLRRLTRKIEKDIKEMYHYQAGKSLEETPPLATFNPDDPQEFIR